MENKLTLTEIRSFIKRFIKINGTYKIKDNSLIVDGDVEISKSKIKYIPVKFHKVTGNFTISNCINLYDLTNAPTILHGNLIITSCHTLNSFEGIPKKCKKFIFTGNYNIRKMHDYFPKCDECDLNNTRYHGIFNKLGSDLFIKLINHAKKAKSFPKVLVDFYMGNLLKYEDISGFLSSYMTEEYIKNEYIVGIELKKEIRRKKILMLKKKRKQFKRQLSKKRAHKRKIYYKRMRRVKAIRREKALVD